MKITTDDNKAIAILRQLYRDGLAIQEEYEDQNYEHRAEAHAMSWLQRARLLFDGLFYNHKFLENFDRAVQEAYNSFNESVNYHTALSIAMGHIQGVGILFKNGYIKDQYLGIDNSTSQKAFIAMSFDPTLEDNFTIGIKPALESLGFMPIHADKQHHNDKIDEKICEWIAESRFVIADYTGHRTGVYYEAGFAKGLGLPVVQVCSSTDFEHLHFDIKTISTLKFDTPSKLKAVLEEHIQETIGRYTVKSPQENTVEFTADMPF